MPFWNSFPLSVGWSCDLINQIKYSKGDGKSLAWCYIRLSHLFCKGDCHISLAGFEEASSHVGEVCVVRNWGRPLADSLKGFEALSPTPNKEWNAAINHISLDTDPSPVECLNEDLSLAITLIEALERTQLSHVLTPDLQNLWDNKYVF